MSIGDGKPIERMRLELDDSTTMEATSLGLLYVAMSRVEKDANWVLVSDIAQERMTYVNKHPQMAERRAEDARLLALSAATQV